MPRTVEPEVAPTGRHPRLPAALASLRYRNYRLLWFGQLVSSSGDWMDQVALNWLVVSQLYDGREAALPVAALNACRLVPILVFTPIGGVLSTLFLSRGMVPLGTLIAGVATTVVGVQWALGGMASVLVVLALLTARTVPRVRAM